jgi:hypothetical protein
MPPDPVSSEFGDYLASNNRFAYYACHSAAAADWVRLNLKDVHGSDRTPAYSPNFNQGT